MTRVTQSGPDKEEDRSFSAVPIALFDAARENSYGESENSLKRLAENSEAVLQDNDSAKRLKTESDS